MPIETSMIRELEARSRAAAHCPKSRSVSEARSSNPATPGNPVPSSAPLDRRRAGASRRVEEAVTL
jgi:hypothetical protein